MDKQQALLKINEWIESKNRAVTGYIQACADFGLISYQEALELIIKFHDQAD